METGAGPAECQAPVTDVTDSGAGCHFDGRVHRMIVALLLAPGAAGQPLKIFLHFFLNCRIKHPFYSGL